MKRNSANVPEKTRIAHACSDARAMMKYDKTPLLTALKEMAVKYRIPYKQLLVEIRSRKYVPTEEHYRKQLEEDKKPTKRYFKNKKKWRMKYKDEVE